MNNKRSKCIICAKSRYHKKLVRINNLWLCGNNKNENIFVNGIHNSVSFCQFDYFIKLTRQIVVLKNSINNIHIMFEKLTDLKKGEFKLKLRNLNF